MSLAHYETLLCRISTSAPTPEPMSVRLAAKVTSSISGEPPLGGSAVAVAVAVGLAVAVAVTVGLAVAVAGAGGPVLPPPEDCAVATGADSMTITATTASRSKIFFM